MPMARDPGPAAFEHYYEQLYRDRWDALRKALLGEARYQELNGCLTTPYFLDPASVAAAGALEAVPGQEVLDLCAAPGGKTLVLACRLAGSGRLVANERSSARRARLRRVLEQHLPEDLRAIITVTGHDAARWAIHEPAQYDRVLADVPCSSERHVLQSAGELAKWSPSRTKRLAQAAYAIGCAAVDAVRPGGRVVYSTCALSPLENDVVVARLLDRGRGAIAAGPAVYNLRSTSIRLPWEPTEHGAVLLPDAAAGAGPMYVAVVEKRAAQA